jgi:hypothetical protein
MTTFERARSSTALLRCLPSRVKEPCFETLHHSALAMPSWPPLALQYNHASFLTAVLSCSSSPLHKQPSSQAPVPVFGWLWPSRPTAQLCWVADLPMSLLSTYYLVKSLNECIGSADAHRLPSNEIVVCDLTAGTPNVIHILCIIKSNSMLLYKARRLSITLFHRLVLACACDPAVSANLVLVLCSMRQRCCIR